jgi:two-component system, NarL family, sensor kinase
MEKFEIKILIYAVSIILFVLTVFLLAIFFLFKRKQRRNFNKISALNDALLHSQIEIQEQTFTNISQELHDNIGQSLSLAKLNLSTIKLNDILNAQANIDDTKALISDTLVNIRDLSRSMLGEKISEIGLEKAIRNELKILKNTGNYVIDFTTSAITNSFSPQQELVAFRIIQETLHNIIKHAEATEIIINIDHQSTCSVITITDNGKGFDIMALDKDESGVGLKNMKNRAKLINADFIIESSLMEGTKSSLKIKFG